MDGAADSDDPPAALPLALLGMAAALICLLCARLAPWMGELRRDAAATAALLRIHHAMLVLCALAWEGLERADGRVCADGAATERMAAAAVRLERAVIDLVARLPRQGARQPRSIRVAPCPVATWPLAPVPPGSRGHARDGRSRDGRSRDGPPPAA